jgi:hypothetical protein
MRQYGTIVLISLILLMFLFGCRNTTDPNIQEESINVSISSSEVFTYATGISGDEEVAKITRQAKNYEISTIVRDSTTNWEAVYQYKADRAFQGTEHVELKLGTGSDGQSPNNDITLIDLQITVN